MARGIITTPVLRHCERCGNSFPVAIRSKVLLCKSCRQIDDPLDRVDFQPVPCAAPTSALPGTPEKIAVLAQRRAAGQDLWHPLDAQPSQDGTLTGPQRSCG